MVYGEWFMIEICEWTMHRWFLWNDKVFIIVLQWSRILSSWLKMLINKADAHNKMTNFFKAIKGSVYRLIKRRLDYSLCYLELEHMLNATCKIDGFHDLSVSTKIHTDYQESKECAMNNVLSKFNHVNTFKITWPKIYLDVIHVVVVINT